MFRSTSYKKLSYAFCVLTYAASIQGPARNFWSAVVAGRWGYSYRCRKCQGCRDVSITACLKPRRQRVRYGPRPLSSRSRGSSPTAISPASTLPAGISTKRWFASCTAAILPMLRTMSCWSAARDRVNLYRHGAAAFRLLGITASASASPIAVVQHARSGSFL